MIGAAKWFTIAAIAVLAAATYMDWYWIWGVLFIYWAVSGVLSGESFLVEPITRAVNPILFWIINAMWGGFGLWAVIGDLTWRFA